MTWGKLETTRRRGFVSWRRATMTRWSQLCRSRVRARACAIWEQGRGIVAIPIDDSWERWDGTRGPCAQRADCKTIIAWIARRAPLHRVGAPGDVRKAGWRRDAWACAKDEWEAHRSQKVRLSGSPGKRASVMGRGRCAASLMRGWRCRTSVHLWVSM